MPVNRRRLLQGLAALGASRFLPASAFAEPASPPRTRSSPLDEFHYGQIQIQGPADVAQQTQISALLLSLNEDSLLKPFRQMSGRPAPGASLGGWYAWKPDFDFHHDDAGFAPASTFGQWTSALSRLRHARGPVPDALVGTRVVRLHSLLRETIAPTYFAQTRFAAYTYDKLVCGLVDAGLLAGDTDAFNTLDHVTAAALPSLPGRVVERERQWAIGRDASWMWDESYTLPENLYRAYAAGAGDRYLHMARAYLENDTLFTPLAQGENVLSDRHAYSYANALCSGMQAWLVDGSELHLRAAINGFALIQAQSFVTGGWGPDELFRKPGYGQVAASITKTHNSFEVPCGSYAHLKLARYLLRVTGDGRYGDSMERVAHNTFRGALPLLPDGRSFYYADYNVMAKRVYSDHRWPCCSGTLPQVIADLGISCYLHEPGAVWVNLYQTSTLRLYESPHPVILEQTGSYPVEGRIQLRFSELAEPLRLALRLRIPAWTNGSATLTVNNQPFPVLSSNGFATIDRTWQAGDLVQLELPMTLRLEAIPAEWAPMTWGPMPLDKVALLRGPEVLFALRNPWETGMLAINTDALLNAQQTGPRQWTVTTPSGPRHFVPWTEIGDRIYTTYVQAL